MKTSRGLAGRRWSVTAVAAGVVALGSVFLPAADASSPVWSIVKGSTVPGPLASALNSVACNSAAPIVCEAVGSYIATTGVDQTLAEMKTGGGWTLAPTPNQGTVSNALNSIDCITASLCVSVGYW